MVQPEERLQQRPFDPFSVHLADGRAFEVRYPDMHIVGTTFLMLGIPRPINPIPSRIDLK